MTIYLNDFFDRDDYYRHTHLDRFEEDNRFLAPFGQWHDRVTRLNNDLELAVSNDKYSDLVINRRDPDADVLSFRFCLAGSIETVAASLTLGNDLRLDAGQCLVSHLTDAYEMRYPAINHQTQWISIFCPTNFLSEFQRSFQPLSPPLQALMTGDFTQPLYQTSRITPAILLALRQVLDCPFTGTLKQMYLEGKVLELLALQFGQWGADRPVAQYSFSLRTEEIDRLYQAKAILTATFQHPPSLIQLAREVGLNDYKLKRGFRELFQTTVLGYVQTLRLAQAQQLLSETERSIEDIAHRVGYQSASHFGVLFKRQTGQTPAAYRRMTIDG